MPKFIPIQQTDLNGNPIGTVVINTAEVVKVIPSRNQLTRIVSRDGDENAIWTNASIERLVDWLR